MQGKGSRNRVNNHKNYKSNYDKINWNLEEENPEYCKLLIETCKRIKYDETRIENGTEPK